MTVTIRILGDKDFFSWLALFEQYGEFYDRPIDDSQALIVWSWLTDPHHPLEGAAAVTDDDIFVGFVHYREFPRTLYGTNGLFVDDLYVSPDIRRQGIARQLMEHAQAVANEREATILRWNTETNNTVAQAVYTEIGATRTNWLTYELNPSAETAES